MNLKNPFHHTKKFPPSVRAAFLLIFITIVSFLFYISPTGNAAATAKLFRQQSTDSEESSGIGGGNIHGDCVAGKKSLPIYCVDCISKLKNKTANENDTSDSSENVKYAALSFDAAWGADDTIRILDILDKYNVKVTFFMTGGWVDAYPDMVKEIYARGHDLGNHSQNHKEMSKLSVSEQKQEIQSVTESVRNLTGYDMFLFRPPYGDYNSTLINTAYSLNYYPIQWSVDSLDWKDYGVSSIIKTVTEHKALDNGAIILMHNGAKYTADALETVITTLQSNGYTLVPISELIIKENFHMDGTGKQIAD
jgi:polysaccharide deacetylase family sporulation protein PdaB